MKTSSIRVEGNIISPELFERLDTNEILGQNSSDFGFDRSVKVKDEIARAWADAKDQWNIFQRRIEQLSDTQSGVEETRKYWILPLLENLGYKPEFQRAAEIVNGNSYSISHRDTNIETFPIHLMGLNDNLDKKRESGGPRMSPHALLQEYLNVSDHLYGIVSNGIFLRILRDSGKLVRLSYLEFNLQRMLEDDLYAEFSIMYRLIHSSRMPKKQAEAEQCIFEQYHQDAIESGSRIREKLSSAVEHSIKTIANGFLSHMANDQLRNDIKDGKLKSEKYFQQLLRFIYRILFLLVIEERDILYPEFKKESTQEVKEKLLYLKNIYYNNYSVSRLRKLADKIYFFDDKLEDLWLSLRNTFNIFIEERYAQKLGLYPLGGDLFSLDSIGVLSESQLNNKVLLECIRNLSLFENPNGKDIIRVNYAALNVEEFGSVYEGLLEYDGVFNINGNITFEFVKSSERSSSGSHYTPEELVQPLIKHSLDYVIEDKLTLAKKIASSEWRIVNGKLLTDGKNSDSIVNINFNINEVIKNEFISRFGSVEKSYGNSGVGLQIDNSISKRGTIRANLSDPEISKFNSGKSGGRLGETENKGISSIHPDSNGESEGIGNSSFINSESRDYNSSSNRPDSETMRNTQQTNAEFTEKPFSQDQINNWWINLPYSTRQSLLSNHFLLSIKTCDVACGSGHILLSAARRIAIELARVRTGEDQPSPEPYRQALRDVINHCIYGVDKNPLAVELCKVALWLEAYNPGMPLSFLDHKIKCGDSIVGLARKEELENGIANEAFKTLPGDNKEIAKTFRDKNTKERKSGQTELKFNEVISEELKNVLKNYDWFNNLPEQTAEEVAAKEKQYKKYLSSVEHIRLKQLADAHVAQFFIPKTESTKQYLITDETYRDLLGGVSIGLGEIQDRRLAYAETVALEKKFFHWFLEFPDVFAVGEHPDPDSSGEGSNGGFDCILGNPPFLGGQRLSGTFGDSFLNYVKEEYAPAGSCDLVTYFFRRIFELLKQNGFQSLISTNTIAQGNAREGGLQQILDSGGTIIYAIKSLKWPGLAGVFVSLISLRKGFWNKLFFLNGKKVNSINSFLDDSGKDQSADLLVKNLGKCFMGSTILGLGFIIDKNEVERLVGDNVNNKEVIFQFINGDDLNTSPSQLPSRWIINFSTRELEELESYPECLAIVKERVYHERQLKKDRRAKEKWWQFYRPYADLYNSIQKYERIITITCNSKTVAFTFLPKNYVYSSNVIVIAENRSMIFAILQSAFHVEWSWKYGSTLKSDLSYGVSNIFETFPFPQNLSKETEDELEKIGEHYHEFRRQLMLNLQLGLTKTYNLFHNVECRTQNIELAKNIKELKQAKLQIPIEHVVKDIETLRQLHKQMDEAVLKAYGWGKAENSEQRMENSPIANRQSLITKDQSPIAKDQSPIALNHDFYEVDYLPENDRIRYTISPEARKEILKCLLELNHKIHAEEVAAGLWEKKGKKPARRGGEKAETPKPKDEGQEKLF